MLLASSACGCANGGDAPRPLVLTSVPVAFSREDPAASVQGKVRFRGGLELRSFDPDFGGLSALLVSGDGSTFLCVSDQAHWVTGTLEYESGNLAAASGVQIAPMLGLDGVAMHEKAGDAEGLASIQAGSTFDENPHDFDLLVSFEGEHRVWSYPFGKSGVRAVPASVAIPAEIAGAPRNGGLEGITPIAPGILFAVSERFRDKAGNYRAWSFPVQSKWGPRRVSDAGIPAQEPGVRVRSIRPRPPFVMTDVRMLPGGDLLTLERRYNPVDGVGIEMRRIPGALLHATGDGSAPLDGDVVASFDDDYEIDNLEGLAVRRGERGETLVYAISDDNFNRPIQRTLLIMYELLP